MGKVSSCAQGLVLLVSAVWRVQVCVGVVYVLAGVPVCCRSGFGG